MKRFKMVTATLMLAVAAMIATGCTKTNEDGNENESKITVTTLTPHDITTISAVCGGKVTAPTGITPLKLGVCWGKYANPTFNSSHLETTNCNEDFVCTLTDLEPNMTYYVRAYSYYEHYYYGEEMTFTTESPGGIFNGHECVDLGLPSHTAWATCNIGAEKPEEYGLYFAWAETDAKTYYDWSTYKYCKGSYNTLTKYCNSSADGYNGFSDNLEKLEPMDDAATAKWGNGWCTPTKHQWEELETKTTHTWTTINGVDGRLFTGPNGNSIFLPAGGTYIGAEIREIGHIGNYWTNLLSGYSENAYKFILTSGGTESRNYDLRNFGRSIRPVRSK